MKNINFIRLIKKACAVLICHWRQNMCSICTDFVNSIPHKPNPQNIWIKISITFNMLKNANIKPWTTLVSTDTFYTTFDTHIL